MSPLILDSVGEWILLAGIICAVFGAVFATPWQITRLLKIDLDKLGLALLFLGALIEIRQAKKKANQTQHYMEDLRKSLKIAQQFDPAVMAFSEAIREAAGDSASIHIHAAGQILREHATDRLPKLAQGLKALRDEGSTLELPSDFAPRLLDRLVKSVPAGGTLWGATHLTSEWFSKDNDDVLLQEIAKSLCGLVEQKKLFAFKLYNLASASSVDGLTEHIDRELRAGIKVKILKDYIPDMTLLWNTSKIVSPGDRTEFGGPAAPLSSTSSTGLCGLLFDNQFSPYLRSVNLIDPRSDQFAQLKRLFEEAWGRATWTQVRKHPHARRANRPDRRHQAA
jgi:hypothetical protein